MTSYLEEARSAKEDKQTRENTRIKGLLLGPSGGGKTTLAVTLPGKLLLIDLDNRAESVIGFPNVEIIDCHDPNPDSPKACTKIQNILKELWDQVTRDRFSYAGVIIDGLSALNRVYMNWALLLDPGVGLGNTPARQHYNPQMFGITRLIQGALPLPCHVVLTAHLRMFEDKTSGVLEWLPNMYGNTRTEICAWFNETYYCDRTKAKKDGKMVREYYINTDGMKGMKEKEIKSSLNHLGKYWTDPVVIDFDKERVGFEHLLDLRFGKEESK